ncbi:MAG: cell division protein ZapA [Ruminococcus sp.]|nr:cell division protein ZapA [Ruminococcus sp.]
MEKNKITVFVASQKLTLITTESEKYVNDIANKVDTVINSLFTSTNMSKERCAIMAALDFCDDEAKAKQALAQVKEQVKDYIEDSAKLRAENEELKAKIEKLEAQNSELLSSKKTMVATSVEIKEKEELKQEVVEKTQPVEISAEDDLSFDIEEKEQVEISAPVKAEPAPQMNTPKSEKKRHNHEHINPFRQRHMEQKNEKKGYTPVRQYSLFEDKKD